MIIVLLLVLCWNGCLLFIDDIELSFRLLLLERSLLGAGARASVVSVEAHVGRLILLSEVSRGGLSVVSRGDLSVVSRRGLSSRGDLSVDGGSRGCCS